MSIYFVTVKIRVLQWGIFDPYFPLTLGPDGALILCQAPVKWTGWGFSGGTESKLAMLQLTVCHENPRSGRTPCQLWAFDLGHWLISTSAAAPRQLTWIISETIRRPSLPLVQLCWVVFNLFSHVRQGLFLSLFLGNSANSLVKQVYYRTAGVTEKYSHCGKRQF